MYIGKLVCQVELSDLFTPELVADPLYMGRVLWAIDKAMIRGAISICNETEDGDEELHECWAGIETEPFQFVDLVYHPEEDDSYR